jgi:PilZ domain
LIENRKQVRQPGNNQAALIYPGPGESPIMCTIADISEGGAGLTVVSTKGIPQTFELQIKSEETRRACKVAWKKDPHKMGVQFVTEPSAVVPE